MCPETEVRRAQVGQGCFLAGADLAVLLRQTAVAPESMVNEGLQCIRRRRPDGYDYFIVNKSDQAVDQWVGLATAAESAVLLDPLFPDRIGIAAVRKSAPAGTQVFLQLLPAESVILRTSGRRMPAGPAWSYGRPAKINPRNLDGRWSVHFREGGPVLPQDYGTGGLVSWTKRDDPEAKRFAGTARYRIEFDFAPAGAYDWRLDLGRVCDSARVRINGREIATLWFPPFSLAVGKYLHTGRNAIEVDATNLGANRIADLDRRRVKWNAFYNIGVVNVRYQPFDASNWPLRDSGLIGPVRLAPIQAVAPFQE